MTLISIRERGIMHAGPVLTVDGSGEYPVAPGDPAALDTLFETQQEQDLAWYFERYPASRRAHPARVGRAAASLTSYGEALFDLLFADRNLFAAYQQALETGDLAFEIVGSPAFHAHHWEALKDPRLPDPLALRFPFVRGNLRPQPVRARVRPSPTLNILIVSARPDGPRDAAYRTISRPLVEALRRADLRVNVDILRPGTYRALVEKLESVQEIHGSGYYHIVHFDLHGALFTYGHLRERLEQGRYQEHPRYGRSPLSEYDGDQAFLFFEGQREGQSDPVSAQELVDLLVYHQAPVMVLNACQSARQLIYAPDAAGEAADSRETSLGAQLMQAGAQVVVAMAYKVTVTAAQHFMTTFYQQLFARNSLGGAVRRARLALHHDKRRVDAFGASIDLEDWVLPVVYRNQEVNLALRDATAAELAAYYGRPAAGAPPSQPSYGFFGRDREILSIERRLSGTTERDSDSNVLLVRGPAGIGKTTLVRYMAHWWRTTGFVEKSMAIDLAEIRHTGAQIVDAIARQFYDEVEYVTAFKPLALEPAAQRAMLCSRLRGQRHLLLLDHADVAASEAWDAVAGLLADLAGGKTLVLLVERGSFPQLRGHSLHHNQFALPPLDEESAALLAGNILACNGAEHYRNDPELARLLALCHGHPASLIWLAEQLDGRSPGDVLDTLAAGDPAPASAPGTAGATAIDAVNSLLDGLSAEQHELALTLAPFAGPIDGTALLDYATHLEGVDAGQNRSWGDLAQLPATLVEAGLASPVPDQPDAVLVYPTTAYLLRRRLAEREPLRNAVVRSYGSHYEARCTNLMTQLSAPIMTQRRAAENWVDREFDNLVAALLVVAVADVAATAICTAIRRYCYARNDADREGALAAALLRHVVPPGAPAAAAITELNVWLATRSKQA